MTKTKRLTRLSLLTAAAMILSYVESLLPSVGVPGIKLGLANIAVIFTLFSFGFTAAAAVSVVRIVLTALLFGTPGTLLYSLAGAAVSLAIMTLFLRSGRFGTCGVSVAGGVGHNCGQILAAMWLMGTHAIAYYLPILIAAGVGAGILTGLCAAALQQTIKSGQP